MVQASCVGKLDTFFPDKGQKGKVPLAKKICATCPVQPQCEDYAERQDTEYGVWGGKLYQPSQAKDKVE